MAGYTYQRVSSGYSNVHPDDDSSSSYEEDDQNYSADADDPPFTPIHRPTRNPDSDYFPDSLPTTQRATIRQDTRPYKHASDHNDRRRAGDPDEERTRLVRGADRRPDHEYRRERDFARDNRNSNETGNRSEEEDGHVVSFRVSQRCVSKCLLIGLIVAIVVGLLVAVIILFVRNGKGHQGECVLRPEHCDPWSAWSGCSVTCGTGVQTRTRNCYGNSTHPWESEFTDSLFCSEQICIGTWSPWGSWSQCSATCGCGLMSRDRTCSTQICEGDKSDYDTCQLGVCASGYSFRPWNICAMLLLSVVSRVSSQCL